MGMKPRKIVFLSLLCVFVLSAGLHINASGSYSRYVTASSLNIRKKASMSGAKVGSYKKGTKVTCYGTTGSWTKVKYNGSYRYISTKYLSANAPAYTRYVTASSLNIRKKASLLGAKAGSYKKGAKVTCYGTTGSWTKVKYNGKYCYVSTQYLSSKAPVTVKKLTSVVTGTTVASYAKQFVGNPYVWGGSSLTKGADCSGFTMAVYKNFGYSLPHSSVSQRNYGTAVSWANKQPGDLICYTTVNGSAHVGIYIGNNQVVHAGSASTGIHISAANYRKVHSVRRLIKN